MIVWNAHVLDDLDRLHKVRRRRGAEVRRRLKARRAWEDERRRRGLPKFRQRSIGRPKRPDTDVIPIMLPIHGSFKAVPTRSRSRIESRVRTPRASAATLLCSAAGLIFAYAGVRFLEAITVAGVSDAKGVAYLLFAWIVTLLGASVSISSLMNLASDIRLCLSPLGNHVEVVRRPFAYIVPPRRRKLVALTTAPLFLAGNSDETEASWVLLAITDSGTFPIAVQETRQDLHAHLDAIGLRAAIHDGYLPEGIALATSADAVREIAAQFAVLRPRVRTDHEAG